MAPQCPPFSNTQKMHKKSAIDEWIFLCTGHIWINIIARLDGLVNASVLVLVESRGPGGDFRIYTPQATPQPLLISHAVKKNVANKVETFKQGTQIELKFI